MEGGALALRDILERLARRVPCDGPLRLTGGGSRSRVWPRIVASIVARPLRLVDIEPSARGAAILAAVVAGWWPDVSTAAARMTRDIGSVRPAARERDVYARAARRFQAMTRGATVNGAMTRGATVNGRGHVRPSAG
jgi:sugar (pentulose or hexulose) kinase